MQFRESLFFADVGNRRVRRVDAATGIITTVAGGGTGDLGDGGPATSATFSSHPMRVAVDRSGNLFVADAHHNRIRRVDAATGIISTVAGNGLAGFSGDGGPATEASIASPHGVAVDSDGHVFIADLGNARIRRVDAGTGMIGTVAGNGTAGFSGEGGAAVSAGVASPISVHVDGRGNVYIADRGNSRIRKVDADTGVITTVAGSGSAGFSGDGGPAIDAEIADPRDVAVDAGGDLLFADARNSRVRRVDAATGVITTVVGNGAAGFSGDGGPATEASISFPYSIALGPRGDIFIADTGINRVRRVDAASGIITAFAGDGNYRYSGDGGPAISASIAIGRKPA